MDFNSYLRPSMLLIGKYDFYSRTFQIDPRKRQISYFCAIVSLFCSLKTLCISVSSNPNTILYLVEIYLVPGDIQRFFLIGFALLHAATGFAYLYWLYLVEDFSRIECFDQFFIPSLTDLCKHYDLEKKPTKKFIQTANQIRFLIHLLIVSIEVLFALFIGRCLVIAYLEIDLNYFLFGSIPLAILTYFSLYCLTAGILSMYCSMFTVQKFLQLRAAMVSKQIRRFIAKQKPYNPSFKQIQLRKAKGGSPVKIMTTINSIVVQFDQARLIFDNLIR